MWFKYRYGDELGIVKYREFKFSPERIQLYKHAGRKSFLARKDKIFNGALAKGKNETVILDFIEQLDGVSIERCKPINGYYCDGYCASTNTVYEVYEKYHTSTQKQIDYDIQRQQNIVNTQKCNFVIIYDLGNYPVTLDQLLIKRIDYDKI